ncbi:MAG: histidine kinase [Deltaproteobacteria bacterium]|nr:histidine kinase [Deltaproteobacteria bacterium]
MSLRIVLSTAVVVIVLAVGTTLFANDRCCGFQSAFDSVQLSALAPQTRQVSLPPTADDNVFSRIDFLLKSARLSSDLLVYGAIVFLALSLIGLLIISATAKSKSNTEALLEFLKKEKEKAENLAKLKSEFLNQVSHELRTPLAVILGYIECMTDGLYGEVESKHQEILQIVAKQSAHLKNMIDQILIYSRLEAGKQPVKIEDLQLTKIVSDMKDTFDFLCRQKGLELRWELSREPMTIRSDAMRLKEVISNLLQNAVKYTDRGSVIVRVGTLPATDSVIVEVKDTGMGISEQHLTSIFEPFMQAHKTSTTHSRGGIGLGLSIVKKHLEQIKGTITVESELNKGSTFRIVVPRNYKKETPKTWRFWKLLKFPLAQSPAPASIISSRGDSPRQKTVDTGHAIG